MAKTFYGYVDRRGANQVDWNSLASEASKSLKEIADQRESKKKELDEINRSLVSATNDVEMGNNQTLNQMLLKGADQSKQFLLMQNRLLKKGLLNPNDYSMAMQNQKDDWSNLKKATENLNKVYDDSMKRLADGSMSAEEAFKKEMLLKFANVQNKGIFVNPKTGRMTLGELDEKGNVISDPDKTMSLSSMNDFMNEQIPKLNVQEAVAKGTTKMADIVKVLRQNNVLTLKDARQNKMYTKAKEDFISSILTNPKNQASVLADYLGGYEFTYDKSKAGGNVIYLEREGSGVGQPRLTKEQETKAREALDAAFEAQMEKIEAPMPVFAPQRDPDAPDRKLEAGIVSNLAKVYYGDTNDVRAALSFFQGLRPDLVDIKRTDSELVITDQNGRLIRVPFKDQGGNVLTQQQFIESAINQITPGVKDINRALRESGINLSRPFNPAGSAEFKVETAVSTKPLSQTMVLGPDNKPATVASLINAIDPDADSAPQILDIIQKISPRITVDAQSNWVDKDKLKIYVDGILVESIDYDDKKDNAILLQALERARTAVAGPAQGSTQTTSSAPGKSR